MTASAPAPVSHPQPRRYAGADEWPLHTNHCPPARTWVGGQEESGRGLLIVDAISAEWGWLAEDDHSGKMVWALIE